ncbi:hypothetical protein N1851_026444 [Merluccius polli]|uniref:DUF5641 domain-containing protein n=1 Tax=Merluccius polli TaxID=89951 RepID=A0AA47MC56_MERPO|nr:hypothetical protein N1851_026444 [Merluccius polli]
MADLPPDRLRLFQPPFFSTGVDCFGPYLIKIGRRQEKHWGLIFKCLTTWCIHVDLLNSLDADAFLLALRRFISCGIMRFISRRISEGTPSEILSDQGTNFRGAQQELLQLLLRYRRVWQHTRSAHQITFKLNPPNAPHFGGAWEREIRSVVMGNQAVSEDVLLTVLIEVEGILNAKPLGYVSSDIADPEPVTPSMLLMGRRDASLPQFVHHYLPTLQVRQKWKKPTENLAQDTVVMIVDPQLPCAHWPVGRVVKLIASVDGQRPQRKATSVACGRTYPATLAPNVGPLRPGRDTEGLSKLHWSHQPRRGQPPQHQLPLNGSDGQRRSGEAAQRPPPATPGAAQASRPSARGPGAQGPMLQEEMGGGSCLVALVEGGDDRLFQALRELPPRPSCRASSEPIQPAPAASYPRDTSASRSSSPRPPVSGTEGEGGVGV